MVKSRNLKEALTKGIESEEKALNERFEKAELTATLLRTPTKQPIQSSLEEHKVVTKTFTLPFNEFNQVPQLQKRCLSMEIAAGKSEIVRAALKLLSSVDNDQLKAIVCSLEKLRAGRPPKDS